MSVIDLNGIKSAVKSILDTANDAAAVPRDLSASLTPRVAKVFTINPSRIPLQPQLYPCVTMFYADKTSAPKDIAVNALLGKREAIINLKIVGIVWNDVLSAAADIADLADNDCENLMENVEECLRKDVTLAGKVLSSYTDTVTYHDYETREGSHMRAGIMNLRIKVQY